MKKNDLTSLRKLSGKELDSKLNELKSSLVTTKLKLKKGELPNKKEPKHIRLDIAQIKTLIKEKQLMEEQK